MFLAHKFRKLTGAAVLFIQFMSHAYKCREKMKYRQCSMLDNVWVVQFVGQQVNAYKVTSFYMSVKYCTTISCNRN